MNFGHLDDIGELEEWAKGQQVKMYDLIRQIKSIVDVDDDVKLYYPKNIFTDKEVSLYLFSKSRKMIEAKYQERKIIVRILDLGNVESCTIETDTKILEVDCLQLTLNFCNEHVVTFNSKEDSNNAWRSEYKEKILEIAKLMV